MSEIWGPHLPNSGPPGWGAWCVTWVPHSLRRTSEVVITLLFVVHLAGYVSLDSTMSLPLLPISLWFLLYISSCGKSSSFSLILALEVVIILLCPWEEMSSRSSYSTILATPSIMIYIFFAFLFLAIPPHNMLDLSSLTRNGIRAPCSGDAES